MKTLLDGKSITKSYGSGEETCKVLDDISLQIKEGEFVSVMGPSGSGKTTLLYAVSGMDKTEKGTVIFDGRDILKMKEKELADLRRTQMGFVFQQPTMIKNLNILDNIILPAMRDAGHDRKKVVKSAGQLMKKTGIEKLGGRAITEVSGGQLQRAGVCRALMSGPKILFGDEPTGALNSKAAMEIMDILCRINQEGTSVLLVTHDAKVAAVSERVLFMRDGKIQSELRLDKFSGNKMDERIKNVTSRMSEMGI